LTGSSFGVEVTCSRVPWGSGEERLLVSLREGESAVEAELVRTGRAAQAVLRSTEEAVCGVDREGRVMLANPAAARLLGARVSAIAGRDLHSLALHTRLDGTPYPPAESPVARTLRSGRRLRRRPEIVWRQDGSPVPVEVSSAPIKDGAEVIGAVLAFNDMTEAGELERRRARLVDVLAAELTPGLAKLSTQAGDQEDLVARLRGIVADAIDYENLMTGQATPEPTAADLRDVVAEAVAARQQAAGERGVELLVHTVEAPAAADGPRLVLALSELIRAAVDATPAGGTVSVTLTGEHDVLRISVDGVEQSTGPAENPLLRWLRPRGSAGGADPDLALVQIVAEAHGGRFLLESQPDGIRSYVIELPRPVPPSTHARKHARNGAAQPAPAPLPTAVIPPQPAMPAVPSAADLPGPMPDLLVRDAPPPQVLVWPEPTPSLATALLARGLASVALARPEQPVIVPSGTAVVFIDPGAGPLRRKRLVELGAAAAAAELPLLAVAGLAEVDGTDPAAEPAVLLNGLVPSGKVERVLIIEEDPALAAAFGAGLALAGVRGWHARSDVEAAGRLAHARPDVVLRNLGGPEPVDTVWLHGPDTPPIPVLAYTTDELAEGHQYRLERGQTVLGLCPRLENATVDQRLAVLLSRLSGMIG
jgi:PAS domain S-box-containing protein